MKAALEIISPAVAKDLLEKNTTNRSISEKTAGRYAADMKAGRWINNGQGIILSNEGELLDGQHRLRAIIASGTTLSMLVVRGVAKETFATMDSGKPRSLADVLGIEGHVHTNTIASVARSAFAYAAGTTQNYIATKATLNAFVANHPYMVEVVRDVSKVAKVFPKTPLSTILFLGNERRFLDVEAAEFIDGVVFGEGLRRGDARHTLREWISAERVRGRGVLRTTTVLAATARAWNAFASGKELAVIKGLANPTQQSLQIFGFERSTYKDVPDVATKTKEVRAANMQRGQQAARARAAGAFFAVA